MADVAPPELEIVSGCWPTKMPRRWRSDFENGFDAAHPGLLPREKENRLPVSWNVVWRRWLERRRANRKRTMRFPLLGERVRVRKVVRKTIPGVRSETR